MTNKPIDPAYCAEDGIPAVTTEFGSPVRWWDDGFGPLWIYRDSLGVLGVVRAQTWHDAWECVEDEIMNGCTYEAAMSALGEEGEQDPALLGEYGFHFRSNGEPSSPWASGELAEEDQNGSILDKLTPELAEHLRLTVNVPWEE